ncbi:MAG: tetraacyldisaccharide 4'-kinase [Halieaceae bacterium]|jgi:tetraacyldisaccharide 4'-kinase|nr:tetraacyldisaccharide 4'-kinase [Halieaceae bacterium]
MMSRLWLERQAEAAWYQNARWAWALRPLSLLAVFFVRWRRRQFLAHPPARPPLTVVVVGGITAGGTGKSPVVLALAAALTERGARVGVISRGYGGAKRTRPELVNPDQHTAADVGDEPLMMAKALDIPVVVSPDRARCVAWLTANTSVDIVLSDDGLQHYSMWRDFEIAILDRERGVGNGWLLPAGPLREPADRLSTVDWVLERNGQDPRTGFCYRVTGLRHARTGQRSDVDSQISDWQDQSVVAATGLGQPHQFFAMLEALGIKAQSIAVADHQPIDSGTLDSLDASIILVTAKDEVKLPQPVDSRIWVVEVDVDLPNGLVDAVLECAHSHPEAQ